MNRKAALLLLATVTSVAACASTPDKLQLLSNLMSGTFDTAAAKDSAISDNRFIDQRIRIQAPELGEHVFYQQLNQGDALSLYRQRIVIFSTNPTGTEITSRSYALRSPEDYVNAGASDFENFSSADIIDFMAAGCEQVWAPIDHGFRGYVDPKTCKIISSRTAKLRAIESVNILTKNSLQLVERGFDAETGKQLFGTPQGQTLTLGRSH